MHINILCPMSRQRLCARFWNLPAGIWSLLLERALSLMLACLELLFIPKVLDADEDRQVALQLIRKALCEVPRLWTSTITALTSLSSIWTISAPTAYIPQFVFLPPPFPFNCALTPQNCEWEHQSLPQQQFKSYNGWILKDWVCLCKSGFCFRQRLFYSHLQTIHSNLKYWCVMEWTDVPCMESQHSTVWFHNNGFLSLCWKTWSKPITWHIQFAVYL